MATSKPRSKTYNAEDVRQGQVALRTPAQRTIFAAGLAGIMVLAMCFAVLAWEAKDDAAMAIDQAQLTLGGAAGANPATPITN